MPTIPLLHSRIHYRKALSYLRRMRVRDVWVLLEIVSLLAQILYLQRKMPLNDLVQRFDARTPHPERPAMPLNRLTRLVTLVMRAVYKEDFCMKRSLILFHYMRKWGYPVHIYFGVAKENGELKGHAWVDLAQRPFAEKTDPRQTFRVTYSYPKAA